MTRLFCKLTTRIFPMNDLTPTERQAAIIADLEARLELANERIFFLASQNAKLLSAMKNMLTEQVALAGFSSRIISSVEGK